MAERVFAEQPAASSLPGLLADYDAVYGPVPEEQPWVETWLAMRTDWALLDAALAPERPGHSLARRWLSDAAHDDVPHAHRLCGGWVSLFEVWCTDGVWLRDRLRGVSLPLGDDVALPEGTDDAPVALWEVRVVVMHARGWLCRRPLPYPVELRHASLAADGGLDPPLGLLAALRRTWLRHARQPRADPLALLAQERRRDA